MKSILMSGSFKKMEIPSNIIDFINKNVNRDYTICFISADFDDFIGNDKFVNKLINEFSRNKIIFKNISIIDNRINKNQMINIIKNNKIIFLLGGDTLKQIKSIDEFNLKKYIRQKGKIVFGISAGAINMAKKVVLARDIDDNIPQLSIYDGIGITDINIEPHCDFRNKVHWNDLIEASFVNKIVVMNDDAYIIIDNDNIKFYGGYCILDKGIIKYKNKEIEFEKFLEEIEYD